MAEKQQEHLVLVRFGGELFIKSKRTRSAFTRRLIQNLEDAVSGLSGTSSVEQGWDRLFVHSDDANVYSTVARVFGVSSISPVESVTPADALRHPTWDMGAKITIDSATLANKALELIEAHFLFGLDYDRLEAVVHPQSIIHSMVEFDDGSVLSQMGFPTMELPILYALTHPDRVDDGVPTWDPVAASPLTFEPIDHDRFPTFGLGVRAGRAGGTAPAVYNAANEEAVAAFLDATVKFVEIPRVIEGALDACAPRAADTLATVQAADHEARTTARTLIEELQ